MGSRLYVRWVSVRSLANALSAADLKYDNCYVPSKWADAPVGNNTMTFFCYMLMLMTAVELSGLGSVELGKTL
jgi:hypothetical protein